MWGRFVAVVCVVAYAALGGCLLVVGRTWRSVCVLVAFFSAQWTNCACSVHLVINFVFGEAKTRDPRARVGWKVIARQGTTVQEVFVRTRVTREALEALVADAVGGDGVSSAGDRRKDARRFKVV